MSQILLPQRSNFHALARILSLAAELLFNFTADITHLKGDDKILAAKINLNRLYVK